MADYSRRDVSAQRFPQIQKMTVILRNRQTRRGDAGIVLPAQSTGGDVQIHKLSAGELVKCLIEGRFVGRAGVEKNAIA
jgi:hypothetical protein